MSDEDADYAEDLDLEDQPAADPAGSVRDPTIAGLPDGYRYGVTRYADIIMSQAFPDRWADLIKVLDGYWIGTSELETGGGGRTPFTARFDDGLERQGWGKRNISISKLVDGKPITRVRGHEIDMFAVASDEDPYPGIGCEMEWNNKDPFYDRDLLNFQALHHEGVLAVGIIVTRGPGLQRWLERAIWNQDYTPKYGKSTTHWNKLVPRVNLGGGGECPLILVGIEAARVTGRELHDEVVAELDAIEDFRRYWRDRGFDKWSDAKREYNLRRKRQIDRLHDR